MTTKRRPWLGTSWKMNKTRAETSAYLAELITWAQTSDIAACVAVFPPYTALSTAGAQLSAAEPSSGDGARRSGLTLQLGAQNMHWHVSGAHTGEISAGMLTDCGVGVVEIGHFERRQNDGENDQTVNLKIAAAVAAGLEAVVCVGDSASDRHYGVSAETVARQVKIALTGLDGRSFSSVILAYEPGWAIGTGGEQATPTDVAAMQDVMRASVRTAHGHDAAEQIRIVYGGSVDAANAHHYLEAHVDGLFIGRAALTAGGFIAVIEQYCRDSVPEADLVASMKGRAT